MKSKLLSLSVAIPAYNEQESILGLLEQLAIQKLKRFKLQGITVYSDQSTDNTNQIVTNFSKKNPRFHLVIGKKRLGKYFRLNQVFKECTSDFLIILDADISLDGNYYLEKLATPLLSDKKALMVSSHQVMIRPSNFVSKIVYTNFLIWDYVRLSIPGLQGGDNFYFSATAFRGSYAKKIKIPTNLTDPHLYLFVLAHRQNGYRYNLKAKIFQQPISTIKDFHKFLRRPLGKPDKNVEKLFGCDVYDVYHVPTKSKLIGFLKCAAAEPVFFPLAILLNLYGKIYLKFGVKKANSSLWEIVTSTKKSF